MKKNILILIFFIVTIGFFLFSYFFKPNTNIDLTLGINNPENSLELKDSILALKLKEITLKEQGLPQKFIQGNRYFMLKERGKNATYFFLNDFIYSKEEKLLYPLKEELQAELKKHYLTLEKDIFGKYLSWDEVNKIFPKFSFAEVKDLTSGLSFTVQRRAGSAHADVQPVTATDSATLKKIYNGNWSWKRRAILVKLNDQYIAASMHGMPHGAGIIPNNNFKGHFCIHFKDSKVHTSKKIDLAHQIMVAKSAGIIEEQIKSLSSLEFANFFLTTLKQEDWQIISYLCASKDEKELQEFIANLKIIEHLKEFKLLNSEESSEQAIINLELEYKTPTNSKYSKEKIPLKLRKDPVSKRWYLDTGDVLLLNNN